MSTRGTKENRNRRQAIRRGTVCRRARARARVCVREKRIEDKLLGMRNIEKLKYF